MKTAFKEFAKDILKKENDTMEIIKLKESARALLRDEAKDRKQKRKVVKMAQRKGRK
jgi:hypothetical protein